MDHPRGGGKRKLQDEEKMSHTTSGVKRRKLEVEENQSNQKVEEKKSNQNKNWPKKFRPKKITPRCLLEPDNEDIHVLNPKVPKCPSEFLQFYNEFRSDLVDKNERRTKKEGKMITIEDRTEYSHVNLRNDLIVKVQKESFYIPSFKAKPIGEECEMKWHEFYLAKPVIPGAIRLPYACDYTSIQKAARKDLDDLVFDPSSIADCLNGLSEYDNKSPQYLDCVMKLLVFLPEGGRFGGLVKKLVDSFFYSVPFDRADAALLREWGRLSRLWIYFHRHPSLVLPFFKGLDFDSILNFIDENVSVLKTLTYDVDKLTYPEVIVEVTELCTQFIADMMNPEKNLYKFLVECR